MENENLAVWNNELDQIYWKVDHDYPVSKEEIERSHELENLIRKANNLPLIKF